MWQDTQDALIEVWESIIGFLPNVVGAVIFLLIGWFVAKIVRNLVHRVLSAVGFDRLLDRSGLGGHVEKMGFADSGLLLAKIVGWMITLVFVKLAVAALGIDSIEELVDGLVEWIPHLLIAIVLIIITGAVANFVRGIIRPMLSESPVGSLVEKVLIAAIWVFGGMLAINEVGFGEDIINQLWESLTYALAFILVIKFGVGGVWAARDRFWPKVYDTVEGK